MNRHSLSAFVDELELIKEASILHNVGTAVRNSLGKMRSSIATAPHRTAEWMRAAPGRSAAWAKAQPGEIAGAVKDHASPLQKMRESWNESKWVGMKGMTVAGGALEAQQALPKEDPEGRGRGRWQRGLGAAVGTASGLVTMRRGFIPSLSTGLAAGYLGGKVGKGIDKLTKKKTDQPPPVPAQPQE